MPISMIHLSVAKKVNPDANIDFYVGNLSPDAIQKPYEIKIKYIYIMFPTGKMF